jgi:hypothetical protein
MNEDVDSGKLDATTGRARISENKRISARMGVDKLRANQEPGVEIGVRGGSWSFRNHAMVAPEPDLTTFVVPQMAEISGVGAMAVRRDEGSTCCRTSSVVSMRVPRLSQAELIENIISEGGPVHLQDEDIEFPKNRTSFWRRSASTSMSDREANAGTIKEETDDIDEKDGAPSYETTTREEEITPAKPDTIWSDRAADRLDVGNDANDFDTTSNRTSDSGGSSGLSSGAMTPSSYGGQSGMASGSMTPHLAGWESTMGSQRSSLSSVKSLISRQRNRADDLSDPSCFCFPPHHVLREDLYDIISHWTFVNLMFFLIFVSCVLMVGFARASV